MSRILIIADQLLTMGDEPLSRVIGARLTAQDLPVEYAAGHADALLRMQMRSFGVVITSCDSSVDEDLALLRHVVFGIFAQVSQRRCLLDLFRQLIGELVLQRFDLFF